MAKNKQADTDDEKPKKKVDKEKSDKTEGNKEEKGDKAGKKKQPKKKKLKKRKTSPLVYVGIGIGATMVITMIVLLVMFFGRKSASQEMMAYLPDDCDEVAGVNLGQMTKYVELYKSIEPVVEGYGCGKAGTAFAKALGQEKIGDVVEYIVQGAGRVGGKPGGQPLEATVLRTKAEYDQGLISKLPGARKDGSANGVDYYSVGDLGLGYPGTRVFAPTNRLVVFCRADTPDAKFKAMLAGNKDNLDATVFPRSGVLGKQVVRGTAWRFTLYGRGMPRPAQPAKGPNDSPSPDEKIQKEIAEIAAGCQGSGIKASIGSREIRGEWLLWQKDSDSAAETVKKWKDKEWVKDSEVDPPAYWKDLANKTGAGKTAPNAIRDALAFQSKGEVFIIRSALAVELMKQGIGSLVGAVAATPGTTPSP